ncbi:MAG: pre-peptidase C-terminal domain-containing protein, partial [Actinomycetota bacterium]|nr:pre-peptidase C-terminal domain-containing protein [Actinomycetota bacterium]
VAAWLTPATASAATPGGGSVSKKSPSVTWDGGPFAASNPAGCVGAADPTCDHFLLQVSGLSGTANVQIAISAQEGDDYDLFVYAPDGTLVDSSATASGNEAVTIPRPVDGTYEVRVQPWLVTPGSTYHGIAQVGKGDPKATIDPEEECLEPVPAAVGVPDVGQRVALDVLVLLDGVTQARGEEIMARAADAYSPIGVDVVARYKSASFTGTEGAAIIQQAKDLVRGQRPRGTDIVYALTSKDITSDGDTGLAGLADCIGGVRFPDRAFAVGEDAASPANDYENIPFGEFTLNADASAKIAAHEIGHLVGAHHHYANCVEGTRSADEAFEVSPCTLMFNFVNFQSIHFSTVNSLVARGHIVNYASP